MVKRSIDEVVRGSLAFSIVTASIEWTKGDNAVVKSKLTFIVVLASVVNKGESKLTF